MFVKEQMQLIKSGPGDLPMMFFVHVAQRHGIREDLIQQFDVGCANPLIQRDRQLGNFAVGLNLAGMLVQYGPGALRTRLELAGRWVLVVGLVLHLQFSFLSDCRSRLGFLALFDDSHRHSVPTQIHRWMSGHSSSAEREAPGDWLTSARCAGTRACASTRRRRLPGDSRWCCWDSRRRGRRRDKFSRQYGGSFPSWFSQMPERPR